MLIPLTLRMIIDSIPFSRTSCKLSGYAFPQSGKRASSENLATVFRQKKVPRKRRSFFDSFFGQAKNE